MSVLLSINRRKAEEIRRVLLLNEKNLIEEISSLLALNKKESIFNFNYNEAPDESKLKFKAFLQFVLVTLKKDLDNLDTYNSYVVDDISDDDSSKFEEKADKYTVYSDISGIRSNLNPKSSPVGYLTYDELQAYNRNNIREHMKDKDFDEKEPEFFLDVFEERIKGMKACYELHAKSGLKTPLELLYLQIESKRESIMLDSIKAKIREQTGMSQAQLKDFIMEELKKMSSYIIWGSKHIGCYYNIDGGTLKTREELIPSVKEIVKKIEEAKKIDENCIKKLMTFLPLSIFCLKNKETGEIAPLSMDFDTTQFMVDYDEAELTEFYINNGIPHDYSQGTKFPLSESENGIIKGPQIQYRLGVFRVLFAGKLKVYSEIEGLFNVFGLDMDLFHNCGQHVNYNIFLNLLKLYLQTIKADSVFSSTLSLLTVAGRSFDIDTDSYDFRYRRPAFGQELFSREMKFLGCHFIKYQTANDQVMSFPLFVFKNEKYQDLIKLPITHADIMKFTENAVFASIYGGNACEINTIDNKGYFVEDGEISPSMSITYHELTNMLYYGAKTYIFGDDKKELYFTMLPNDNPELQNLVRLLKMTQVFCVKGKMKGFKRERFKVVTKEEAVDLLNEKPPTWRLMGKQVIDGVSSFKGGYKKSNKSNNKIKITKTRKILKLKQHNKTNKTKKNTKTKKTKKNNKSHKIYARKTKKLKK